MKKLALALMFVGTLAAAQTKKVVSSDINWWGYKVMKTESSSHYGDLKVKEGSVTLNNNQIVGGNFVLDMNSIATSDLTGDRAAKLNAHLKNGDFFETDKFPTASFKITSVKKSASKEFPFTVNGNFTAKGKTAPVSFPTKIGMNKGILTLISDKFSIDRQKWDIMYQSAMQDVVIKDDIDLQINFTAK